MREIKFRQWDSIKRRMYENIGITGPGSWCGFPYVTWEKYPIMQFTSLHDRNGKEIFEGDILQIETENHQIINVVCKFGIARRIMSNGCVVDIPSFYLERGDGLKSFPIVYNWQGKHDLEIMKIIGNIHENSELLEG